MRDCESANLRETLPELLNERLADAERDDVLAHLSECSDCDAELALLRAARTSIVASAPAVDAGAIARAVGAQLAAQRVPTLRLLDAGDRAAPTPPRSRPAARVWFTAPLRAAAAVLVIALGAGGAFFARRGDQMPVAGSPSETPLTIASAVRADSIASVAASVASGTPTGTVRVAVGTSAAAHPSHLVATADAGEPASALGSTFDELSDDELAAVIRAVDADGGLPTTEPQPTPDVIIPARTRGGIP